MENHQLRIDQVKQNLALWKEQGVQNEEISDKRKSNTMRQKKYRKHSPSLHLSALKHVLHIDAEKGIAKVEPNVSMEALVDACLPYGYIPAVVPEFKGISVGGAINGAALESSSHRHGQFNDICLSYEVLLGNGEVITVSPEKNPELFYGIGGSFGTLGYLLSIELQLVPTTGWLAIQYQRFKTTEEAISFIQQLHRSKIPPEMIEGIVYSKERVAVIYASHISREEAGKFPQASFSRYWDRWFYSHVDTITHSHETYQEAMPIRDYLFRHDRGAFWMAGFSNHYSLLGRYWLHKCGLESKKTSLPHCIPKNPNQLYRMLFGWIVSSQRLYASLHNGSEDWFEKNFVIQDFYLPEKETAAFVNTVLEKYRITPIWLCPICPTNTPQLFSPHYQPGQELLINVGVYGMPYKTVGPEAVRDLELAVYAKNGRKMFYCHSYLTEEEFWQVYPQRTYQRLRQRYGLDGVSLEITDKVLQK